MIARGAAIGAYVNALAALAQFLTSDPSVGLLNNLAGVVWAVSFLPIAIAFYLATRAHATIASAAVFAVGIVGMAGSASLEVATATGRLTFPQESIAYLPVFGGLGVWLVMSEALVLLETDWQRGPLILGIAVGASWFGANLLFGAGGVPQPDQTPPNDAADIGQQLMTMATVLQPFWGLWLARALRRAAAPTR